MGKDIFFEKMGKRARSVLILLVLMALLLGAALDLKGIKLFDDKYTNSSEYTLSEENKLIVYTAHKPEIYEPIVREFEEETGIWVQIVSGPTSEVLTQIADEAGKDVAMHADVMFGGGVDSLCAYSDFFEPYVPGDYDLLDSSYAAADHSYTVFSELPTVFIYNTKLVSKSEKPKSWEELLSGDYDGQIAFADPMTSGSSYTAMLTMLQVLGRDGTPSDELMERFAGSLSGDVLDGSDKVVREVISGRKMIGITTEEVARKNMAGGTSIAMVYPADGTASLPDGCALVKGAAHPDNAKAFIDFVVGKEIQKYLTSVQYRRSVRRDILTDHNINTFIYDIDYALSSRDEILGEWTALLNREGGAL